MKLTCQNCKNKCCQGILVDKIRYNDKIVLPSHIKKVNIEGMPLKRLNRKEWVCEWFDRRKKICKHYELRPLICREYMCMKNSKKNKEYEYTNIYTIGWDNKEQLKRTGGKNGNKNNNK